MSYQVQTSMSERSNELDIELGNKLELESVRVSVAATMVKLNSELKCSICLSAMDDPLKLNGGNSDKGTVKQSTSRAKTWLREFKLKFISESCSLIVCPIGSDSKCTYCRECIAAHGKHKIMSKEKLTCPNCWADISYLVAEDILSEGAKSQYDKFERQKKVDRDPHLHWGPRIDCDKYVHQVPKANNKKEKATCECGFDFCIACREQWHPTESCDKAQDSGYLQFLELPEVKKCPQCKSVIQKIEGGNQMKCNIGSYEFCWAGGAKYTVSHLNGLTVCTYDGEHSFVILFVMIFIPLIMVLFAFVFAYCGAKELKGNCGFCPFGFIIYFIAFLFAIPLACIIQLSVPFIEIILVIVGIKLIIKKCRNQSQQI